MLASCCNDNQYIKGKEKVVINIHFKDGLWCWGYHLRLFIYIVFYLLAASYVAMTMPFFSNPFVDPSSLLLLVWSGLVWFCLVSFVGWFVCLVSSRCTAFPGCCNWKRCRHTPAGGRSSVGIAQRWQCMLKGYERKRACWRLQRGYCRFFWKDKGD